MNTTASADIVLFGGGIAGLWLLHRLREIGLSAILFECGALGGGQTHKSQGIIHGGMKYALQGVLTNETKGMLDLPNLWKDCLQGRGEIDLSAVPILSQRQYLWSPSKITGKLTGLFASATLESTVNLVYRDHYPVVFKTPAFKGQIYELNEMVIDVNLLIRELVKLNSDAIYKIEPLSEQGLNFNDDGRLQNATLYHMGKELKVNAQYFIFTAGAGNQIALNKLNHPGVGMQQRPLHMVMVKTKYDYPVYGHCLGLSPRPRITITTHTTEDGHFIWYLGGSLAEDGVGLTSQAQIRAARKELAVLFSWLDFSEAEFSSFLINRAEPLQKNGLKPESSYFKAINNIIIAWPTKLALAPKLCKDILVYLQQQNIKSELLDTHELRAWPIPPLAVPVWEEAFCKSVA